MAQLMAGQGRRQQHQGIGLWVQLVQETDKGFVQGAQPTPLDPTCKQLQQVGGTIEGQKRLQR